VVRYRRVRVVRYRRGQCGQIPPGGSVVRYRRGQCGQIPQGAVWSAERERANPNPKPTALIVFTCATLEISSAAADSSYPETPCLLIDVSNHLSIYPSIDINLRHPREEICPLSRQPLKIHPIQRSPLCLSIYLSIYLTIHL